MAEALSSAHDTIKLSDPPEIASVEASSTSEETDILNQDVMIDLVPDRPCGTIRVKLVYTGRSTPIPADNPSAE